MEKTALKIKKLVTYTPARVPKRLRKSQTGHILLYIYVYAYYTYAYTYYTVKVSYHYSDLKTRFSSCDGSLMALFAVYNVLYIHNHCSQRNIFTKNYYRTQNIRKVIKFGTIILRAT